MWSSDDIRNCDDNELKMSGQMDKACRKQRHPRDIVREERGQRIIKEGESMTKSNMVKNETKEGKFDRMNQSISKCQRISIVRHQIMIRRKVGSRVVWYSTDFASSMQFAAGFKNTL